MSIPLAFRCRVPLRRATRPCPLGRRGQAFRYRSAGPFRCCVRAFRVPPPYRAEQRNGAWEERYSPLKSPRSIAFFLCRSTVARPMFRSAAIYVTVKPSFSRSATWMVTASSMSRQVQASTPASSSTSATSNGSVSLP